MRIDKYEFNVPDEIWEKVVPKELQNHVVCLTCFDDFAKTKGIEYAHCIKETGKKADFVFEPVLVLSC